MKPGDAVGLSVEIPMTLPSAANLREHHMVRHRRVKAQRVTVALALRANGAGWRLRPLVPGGRLYVSLCRGSPRKLDSDNLQGAFKAVRDEVAAFFRIDDGDPRIEWLYAQAKSPLSYVRISLEVGA